MSNATWFTLHKSHQIFPESSQAHWHRQLTKITHCWVWWFIAHFCFVSNGWHEHTRTMFKHCASLFGFCAIATSQRHRIGLFLLNSFFFSLHLQAHDNWLSFEKVLAKHKNSTNYHNNTNTFKLNETGLIWLCVWFFHHSKYWYLAQLNSGCYPKLKCNVRHRSNDICDQLNVIAHDEWKKKLFSKLSPLKKIFPFKWWIPLKWYYDQAKFR